MKVYIVGSLFVYIIHRIGGSGVLEGRDFWCCGCVEINY
jgi:hypothetical protein